MTLPLPEKPDLRRLRDHARSLLRACLRGDSEALERLHSVFPDEDVGVLKLANAQAVIAREYGFPSWPKLKAHVEALVSSAGTPVLSDAEILAQRWFDLADAGDVRRLGPAMAVAKSRLEKARNVMRTLPGDYRRFLDALILGIADSRPRVRFECAHALDTFGDETCRPPLIALMEDHVPRVRWMAMHALTCHACGGNLGALDEPVGRRIAEAALGDVSPKVRRHASWALGVSGWAGAAPVLRQILAEAQDPKLRQLAEGALRTLERPSVG